MRLVRGELHYSRHKHNYIARLFKTLFLILYLQCHNKGSGHMFRLSHKDYRFTMKVVLEYM